MTPLNLFPLVSQSKLATGPTYVAQRWPFACNLKKFEHEEHVVSGCPWMAIELFAKPLFEFSLLQPHNLAIFKV
jgi:hypothetical protein